MTGKSPRGLTKHHTYNSWRWVPTPERRKAGWRSATFNNPDGTHMTYGQAFDAAQAINDTVAAFEAGEDITGRPWAFLNAATSGKPARPAKQPTDTVRYLIDAYVGTWDPALRRWTNVSEKFAGLTPNTQDDARKRLHRLVETLAGHKEGKPQAQDYIGRDAAFKAAMTRYTAAMATAGSLPVAELVPLPPRRGQPAPRRLLETAYLNLARMINPATGQPMITNAAAVMRYTSGWLTWVRKQHGLIDRNPVEDIDIIQPRGRVAVWSDDEVKLFLSTAREHGWHSIAYAVELALELSWSQVDILALTWGQIRDGRVRGTRSKTDNTTHTTLTRGGRDIVARLKADWQARYGQDVEPSPAMPLLVVDTQKDRKSNGAVGKPWRASYFRSTFIEIKHLCDPPIIDRTFQDLRDTAITKMKEKGLNDHQIQSRSQHSLTQIKNIMDKHYGMTTLVISDEAAAMLDR